MGEVVGYKICSVDGSRLHKSNDSKFKYTFSLLNDDGRPNPDRFNSVLDNSMDIQYLKKVVYPKHSAEMKGKHFSFLNDKKCISAIINVTFEHSIKEFEHIGNGIYCDPTKNFDISLLSDHKYVDENGELVAIEVINQKSRDKKDYEPVKAPLDEDTLGDYFEYGNGGEEGKPYAYRLKKTVKEDKYTHRKKQSETKIRTLPKATTAEIRERLYRDGFSLDGMHYKRYKRSAGSGRAGSCLFIAEPLYNDMMRWSACGLDSDLIEDKASWEAYISLTLSSMIDSIELPKESIMLVPDVEVVGEEEVVCVTRGESRNGETTSLNAERKTVQYKNKIWDGEALLDESVFEAYENELSEKSKQKEPKHGMMLLRNRMFKTCAFRTRLQKYFKDHNICRVKDLGGYTLAKHVEDIKLVVTESSVKYIKLYREAHSDASLEDAFKAWLDTIYKDKNGKRFGIVKQDKKTGPMNNCCVYTNYQILNTLNLSKENTENLLKDSLDFLHKFQSDPMYLRYQSQMLAHTDEDFDEDDCDMSFSCDDDYDPKSNYRYELIKELLSRSDDAARLDIYTDYRADLSHSFREKLKRGRIIVEGNYETLLGNPLEFLRHAANKEHIVTEPEALMGDEIYTKRFKDGEALLCARSPHITMGNVLVATNKYVEEIDKYFDLGDSNAIVCVNAIKSNIQQRLNGCDYDSDTMLITNNQILLKAAEEHKGRFPVPYCGISINDHIGSHENVDDEKAKNKTKPLYQLDIDIANSKIGEIVNLSQFLNCLYWDGVWSGKSEDELERIYNNICKLAVLSGIEIDKAKRDMKVSASKIIRTLQEDKRRYREDEKNSGLPQFYVHITNTEKSAVSKKAQLNAPLSYVWDIVTQDAKDNPAPSINPEEYSVFFGISKTRYNQRAKERSEKLCELAENLENNIKPYNIKAKKSKSKDHILFNESIKEKLAEALEKSEGYLKSDADYYYTVDHLDSDENRHLTLLYLVCFAHKNKEKCLLNKIRHNDIPMLNLIQDDSVVADEKSILIYGHPHRME